jgi:hypothetical protein
VHTPSSGLSAGLKTFLRLILFAALAHVLLGETGLALVDLACFAAGWGAVYCADRHAGASYGLHSLDTLSRAGARLGLSLLLLAAAAAVFSFAAWGIQAAVGGRQAPDPDKYDIEEK